MLLRRVSVVIFFIGLFFDVIAQNRTNETCGIQALENQYPWLIAIEYEYKNDQGTRIGCTGALLSVKHGISKINCINNNEREAKSVILGLFSTVPGGSCGEASNGNDCLNDGNVRVPIEMFIPHPSYSKFGSRSYQTATYDIVLVRFREMVSYSDAIRPICLPISAVRRLAATDLDLYVTGLDKEHVYKKIHTATTYLDDEKCAALRFDRVVPEDLICVKDKEAVDSCLISGGLLVNKRRDTYELVGLLDIGSSCGLAKRFSHMFLYLDWIRSEIPEWTPCGRRKVEHIELIVYGESTKAGDWPWHVAIYRLEKSRMKYICGGTLISKTVVLTAAHCTTISGFPVAPEMLSVVLGKYYLTGANLESQEKEVQLVIVHEDFAPKKHLDNDIALLKLKSAATYNQYVQPACIWSKEASDRVPNNRHVGTVVGWGLDQSDALSSSLKRANMPQIPDAICIKKNPLFYSNVLDNNRKFCAGWANGTATCNGDSGGGFVVFVPITAKAESPDAAGSWYVKGIVSLSAALRNKARCDPHQYVVFTDIAKYTEWIQKHLEN